MSHLFVFLFSPSFSLFSLIGPGLRAVRQPRPKAVRAVVFSLIRAAGRKCDFFFFRDAFSCTSRHAQVPCLIWGWQGTNSSLLVVTPSAQHGDVLPVGFPVGFWRQACRMMGYAGRQLLFPEAGGASILCEEKKKKTSVYTSYQREGREGGKRSVGQSAILAQSC